MKTLLLISALFLSFSAMAINCDIYLVMSEIDGRPDITDRILGKFEEKGYRITRVRKSSLIPRQGSVSYMLIFSDVHKSFGSKTNITIKDFGYDSAGNEVSRSEQTISLSKKPLFGLGENALIKDVSKVIPQCL